MNISTHDYDKQINSAFDAGCSVGYRKGINFQREVMRNKLREQMRYWAKLTIVYTKRGNDFAANRALKLAEVIRDIAEEI